MLLLVLWVLTHVLNAAATSSAPVAGAGTRATDEVAVDVGAFTIGTPPARGLAVAQGRGAHMIQMRRQPSISTVESSHPQANPIMSLSRMASQQPREKILINPSDQVYRCYSLSLDCSRMAVTITRPIAYLSATLGSISLALGAIDSYLPAEYIPDGFKSYCLGGSIICFSISGVATALSATFNRSISSSEQWLDDVNKFRQRVGPAAGRSEEFAETSSQDSR